MKQPVSGSSPVRQSVDWPSFLARQDPLWTELPSEWYDAPFLGNGELGTLVRRIGEREIRWDAGSSFVQDHRQEDDYSFRSSQILNRGRLPIGHFVLRTRRRITGGTMRLRLWDAEATGTIDTEAGRIEWRTLVHARDMVFLVELRPEAGEADATFDFVPEKAESYRMSRLLAAPLNPLTLSEEFRARYRPNPPPALTELPGGIRACEQLLAAGGATVTAWHTAAAGPHGGRDVLVTIQHTYPGMDAHGRARAALTEALATDRAGWIEAHRAWWHAYWPESFLSVPDRFWESFYWMQMYKLACATRADRAVIDNQGPWAQPTPWNGTWWDLNVQLSYSPVPTSNRLHLGQSLVRLFRERFQDLVDTVPTEMRHDSAALTTTTSMTDLRGELVGPGCEGDTVGRITGNLAWICHNLHQIYRHGMDVTMMRELLYPLLKRAVGYYRHYLREGADGKLHLPATFSPEYEVAPDCNYDLAGLRWGCTTLIELARRQGVDQKLVADWQGVLDRLTPYPTGEHGFSIGAGVELTKGHRHWSHLLMAYPLRELTPESGGADLIRRSLAHWHSFSSGLAGYTFTGGASFHALLGDGDAALRSLNGLKPYLHQSTMYQEAGPCIETPLHAAQAIHEMLLQSHGGLIRVFPAVPAAWADVAFHDLRAEGAFLVSALRRAGKTRWVRIKSLAGEPCRVRPGLVDGEILELPLRRGEERLLRGGVTEEPVVSPVR